MTPFSGTSGPFSEDGASNDLPDDPFLKPYESPSPRTIPADYTPHSIPIPQFNRMEEDSPHAGPSSEGALNRRASGGEAILSPASAPAVPSAVAVAHPSIFIHTHHPRRGSLTPLGLNVISPMPPIIGSPAPIRSVGFSPTPQPFDPAEAARRASTTSTSSTLTQSRPASSSNPPPPGIINRDARRPSLTPSIPSLAPASPTRAYASGRSSRPTSSDGTDALSHGRLRANEIASSSRHQSLAADPNRRGSMPHLNYGGWTGHPQRQWSPSLPPPPTGSAGSSTGPDEGYRFGEGAPDPLSAAFEMAEPFRRLSSASRRTPANAFEEMEVREAERQRRAFLDATYGQDGRRARERLSFAASHAGTTPGAPQRRQSLALWERVSISGRSGGSPATAMTEPSALPSLANATSLEDLGPRRGSLPIPIPGGGTGRAPPRVQEPGETEDAEPASQEGDLAEASDEEPPNNNRLLAPQRPLPPLMPLSDPGPRLLTSTLALHRANHLLNSKNLQAAPLPAPLPPSLHPPAPVDLAEFDIDFILAGSQAQLGGDAQAQNAPVDASNSKDAPPTLKLGEGEDSFAKFVGQFDDEYGDRRGEWTFRPITSTSPSSSTSTVRAKWDCVGAGKYEIHSNGDVRSLQTQSIWRVQKVRAREYELEEKNGFQGVSLGSVFVLTSKTEHNDRGGIKTKNLSIAQIRTVAADEVPDRGRMGSTDSGATARLTDMASSLPIVGALTPKKKGSSREKSAGDVSSSKVRVSGERPATSSSARVATPTAEEKKKGGFGGALKRAIKSTLNSDEKKTSREERDRERMQSQSWSPGGSRSKEYVHPSGKGIVDKGSRSQTKTAPAAMQDRKSKSPMDQAGTSASSSTSWLTNSSMSRPKISPRPSTTESVTCKPGKAWAPVPEESVAMVIPIEDDEESSSSPPTGMRRAGKFSKLALIVWYVPFNSETEDQKGTTTTTPSSSRPSMEGSSSGPSSLPKFQKLLRRRASKDKDSLKKDREGLFGLGGLHSASTSSTSMTAEEKTSCAMHPLPFRAFRIVAKIAEVDDVLSETSRASVSRSSSHRAPSTLSSTISSKSPLQKTESISSPSDDQEVLSTSTGPNSAVSAISMGRTFPTVIAVCHSRSSGVEFVLEGLDRLGFCEGESAWGPTGYEEWRGSGLSTKGRELLDLLWAGCVCVMGLAGV